MEWTYFNRDPVLDRDITVVINIKHEGLRIIKEAISAVVGKFESGCPEVNKKAKACINKINKINKIKE